MPKKFMKNIFMKKPAARLLAGIPLLGMIVACHAKSPVDYVDTRIGTDAHGHVYPGATVPFGMVQLSPDTRDNGWDGCGGGPFSHQNLLWWHHHSFSGCGGPGLG